MPDKNESAVTQESGSFISGSPCGWNLALYFCFFISGIAGLIYEVLWEKYLSLFVGGTGLAQIIVLSTFMGGLALGSHFLGRMADRMASPLRFYMFLELGIGVYALLFDRIFELSRILFIVLVKATGLTAGSLIVAKVLSCSLCVLLPTFLMGGTMPALARYMIRSLNLVGQKISFLYFLNSLGAVCGCVLAGFYLIQAFGLQFAMVIGGTLNLLAGLVALVMSVQERRYGSQLPAPEAPSPAPAPAASPAAPAVDPRWFVVLLLVCASVSGAVSMLYEVAWIRLLTLVLGSSTYSFSLMLATFILGLALGGWLLSRWRRQDGYGAIFGLSEIFVGVTVLLSLPFYLKLPYWFNQIASSLSRETATFPLYECSKFLLCAAVMIVPTILQGITLPAATKLLTRNMGALGGRIGFVFAVNTLGTLVGAVFAGFIGLPFLGIKGTLELAVAINGVLGLAILFSGEQGRRNRKAVIFGAAGLALAWIWYGHSMQSWDRDVLSAGTYRARHRIESQAALVQAAKTRDTIFYRDGVDATIAVQDVKGDEPERILVVNGKTDASSGQDMATQKMLGHVPMLIHGRAENTLVIGIGSGATVGAVLGYDIRQLDAVEISRDVIEASHYFASINASYWQDPRVRVIWEDAKTFLQVSDRTYDVIISEPSNPWMAGVAGVFSLEYFEECAKHMQPDGLFVQWVQAYEIEDITFYMILETFTRVFPYYTLFNPSRTDTLLVGSLHPFGPDFARMRELAARPAVAADLQMVGIESVLPLLAMQMTDRAWRNSFVAWFGAVHSDYFPVLEYVAPRGFFVGSNAAGVHWLDDRGLAPANSRLWLPAYLRKYPPTAAEFRNCYRNAAVMRWLFDRAPLMWAELWRTAYPEDREALEALISQVRPSNDNTRRLLQESGTLQDEFKYRKMTARLDVADYMASRNSLIARDTTELQARLRALSAAPEGRNDLDLQRWLGELEYDAGLYPAAVTTLQSALRRLPLARRDEITEAAMLLCSALLAEHKPGDARIAYDTYLRPFRNTVLLQLLDSRITAAVETAEPK